MITECILAFGGNSPDTPKLFQRAVRQLDDQGIRCIEMASVIQSKPMGAQAGTGFQNTAGRFSTDLLAIDLLSVIHQVEANLGRQRTLHWGPRSVDIDLIFYGNNVIDTPELVVPHPCAWYRSFVISPLAEICPKWIHPTLNESVGQLQEDLLQRPLKIAITCHKIDLSADALVQAAWSEQDRSQLRLGESFDPNCFCEIMLQSDSESGRTQPRLESERLIRCPVSSEKPLKQATQFLKDFASAVLG